MLEDPSDFAIGYMESAAAELAKRGIVRGLSDKALDGIVQGEEPYIEGATLEHIGRTLSAPRRHARPHNVG